MFVENRVLNSSLSMVITTPQLANLSRVLMGLFASSVPVFYGADDPDYPLLDELYKLISKCYENSVESIERIVSSMCSFLKRLLLCSVSLWSWKEFLDVLDRCVKKQIAELEETLLVALGKILWMYWEC
ncbi:hypothetical protein TNIN_224401 [Trichonephila inaurata madagascariensis]|uniref:Uncharacterized protein n=1 Tax=Trichonephila inaurata madagascariensis TaxID=2747483 RepID=A0A8X7CH36_9ARAC|nr:hypothetical protein TNIN_224401 [Trichonephila inaurata madagascariensis]